VFKKESRGGTLKTIRFARKGGKKKSRGREGGRSEAQEVAGKNAGGGKRLSWGREIRVMGDPKEINHSLRGGSREEPMGGRNQGARDIVSHYKEFQRNPWMNLRKTTRKVFKTLFGGYGL